MTLIFFPTTDQSGLKNTHILRTYSNLGLSLNLLLVTKAILSQNSMLLPKTNTISARLSWASLMYALLNSIKEMNKLSQGVSNIYLKITSPVFGELQLTQLLWSF